MKTLLWLDDCRDPLDADTDWLTFSCIGRNVHAVWVKSYCEFVSYIEEFGLPDGINFDHDLADTTNIPEKTGMDCVKWLVDYCIKNKTPLPLWHCHSANPVGRKNMDSYLLGYWLSTKWDDNDE